MSTADVAGTTPDSGTQPVHSGPHPFVPGHKGSEPGTWLLEVTPGVANVGGYLFGGCSLAAAVWALEEATGRPCIYTSCQLSGPMRIGETVELRTSEVSVGYETTQAAIEGRVDGKVTLVAQGAAGRRARAPGIQHQWEQMPEVGAPGTGRQTSNSAPPNYHVMNRFERDLQQGRMWEELDGSAGEGETRVWCKFREMQGRYDAAALAVIADIATFGILQSAGLAGNAQSLDNAIRFVQPGLSEWVLLCVRMEAAAHGYGHASVVMFSEDGKLLASGSQSAVVRGPQ